MNQVMSRLKQWFPPIYRTDQGFSYSLRSFLTTLRTVTLVVIPFVLIGIITIAISNSRSTANWWETLRWLIIVPSALFLLWQAFEAFRSTPSTEETKRQWREVNEDPDVKALVAAAASTFVLNAMQTPDQEPPPNVKALLIVTNALYKQGSFKTETVVLPKEQEIEQYLQMGLDLMVLFEKADTTLAPIGEGGMRIITEETRNRLKVVLDYNVYHSRANERHFAAFHEMMHRVSRMETRDPEIAVQSVVQWLHSINIGFAEAGKKGFAVFESPKTGA